MRSRSGSRGSAAADAAAASSTSAGNSAVTSSSAWIVAIPSRRVRAATPSSAVRTWTVRLLGMSSTLTSRRRTPPRRVTAVLILLPPSEGKAAPRRGRPLDLAALSFPGLATARARVLDALVDLAGRDDAARGARPGRAPRRDLVGPGRPAAHVADRAGGADLHRGAVRRPRPRARSRPPPGAGPRRGSRSSRRCSGCSGPSDRIPAYRLSGDASLPGLGPVAGVWRAALDPVVREALGAGLLVDLRSTTYAAFWRPAADLAPRVATVRVLHEVDGRRQVVSHFNKATKGRLVRALLEDGRHPRTAGGAGRPAARPRLEGRGRATRAGRAPASTSSSTRSEPLPALVGAERAVSPGGSAL